MLELIVTIIKMRGDGLSGPSPASLNKARIKQERLVEER